jgi:hypothetical protein
MTYITGISKKARTIGKNKEYRISTTCADVVNIECSIAPRLQLLGLGLDRSGNQEQSYKCKNASFHFVID